MNTIKKICNRLTLNCVLSVTLGLSIAVLAVMGLKAAANHEVFNEDVTASSSYAIHFPQDEHTLKLMAAEMQAEADVILPLPDIEPAAGQ